MGKQANVKKSQEIIKVTAKFRCDRLLCQTDVDLLRVHLSLCVLAFSFQQVISLGYEDHHGIVPVGV